MAGRLLSTTPGTTTNTGTATEIVLPPSVSSSLMDGPLLDFYDQLVRRVEDEATRTVLGGTVTTSETTTNPNINNKKHSSKKKTEDKKVYDLIVVGGGAAGLTAAKFAAGTLHKSVLLIEQSKRLGGDCTWTGCVPSKSLVALAREKDSKDNNNKKEVKIKSKVNETKIAFGSTVSPGSTTGIALDSSGTTTAVAPVEFDHTSAEEQMMENKKTTSTTNATSGVHGTNDSNPGNLDGGFQQRIATNIYKIYQMDDSPQVLQSMGVTVVWGRAILQSSHQVRVHYERGMENSGGCHNTSPTITPPTPITITAKRGILLCTGAEASVPSSIQGLDSVPFYTSETIWSLTTIPERFTVIGGGPVGCEIAQAMARMGSTVTLITSTTLLPHVGTIATTNTTAATSSGGGGAAAAASSGSTRPSAAELLHKIFIREGIRVVSGRAIRVMVDPDKPHSHRVIVRQKSSHGPTTAAEITVDGDQLLIAAGRTPRVEGMGLEHVGVAFDKQKGGIVVNDRLQTTIKSIYAAGDCIAGGYQYTHYAGFQGAIAARNILLPFSDVGVLPTVPTVTYTSPEIATMGLTHIQARDQYGAQKVDVAYRSLTHVDRAICDDRTEGFIEIVYHKKHGQILGAIIMAPSAGELLSELSVAMKAKVPFHELAKVMHAYPTYSMAIQLMAVEVYYERTMRFRAVYEFLKRIGL